MYTQCPQCLTYFQVTPEHLRIAQGNVRCGQCRNVFSALGNLTEEPPKSAYQDNDTELEEEIFIDEEELEGYGEEYEENIINNEYAENYSDKELPEEYQEDYYIIEDEIGEEQLQQPPADMEKTMIGSPPGHANRHNLRPQAQSANVNSKLNEAIATIERLKQSYSNLSIRKLEQNNDPLNIDPIDKKADSQTPQRSRKETSRPAAPADSQTNIEGPPSSAEIFSPFIEKRENPHKTKSTPPPPAARQSDIAIEQYPDDDGVDYEEALNALNELKIIEEEDSFGEDADSAPISEQSIPASSRVEAAPQPTFNKEAVRKDSTVNRKKLDSRAGRELKEKVIKSRTVKPKPVRKNAKAKSLDHQKGSPEPAPGSLRPAAAEIADLTSPAESEVKYLPAIPKQLLEDFHPTHGHISRLNSLWAIGSLMLMAMFLIQTVYFKHNDLARITYLRPWVEKFCGYMSCTLSLPSDVKQLELVSQDIRSHPKVKSALLVTTTIINNAGFAQAYPGLQITFTDLNGQRVAMRRFAPSEYLTHDVVQADGMPPNTPIQVELEMMDPGSNAVNFEFDFIPLS